MTENHPDYDAYLDDPDDDATELLSGLDVDTPSADDPDPEPEG